MKIKDIESKIVELETKSFLIKLEVNSNYGLTSNEYFDAINVRDDIKHQLRCLVKTLNLQSIRKEKLEYIYATNK